MFPKEKNYFSLVGFCSPLSGKINFLRFRFGAKSPPKVTLIRVIRKSNLCPRFKIQKYFINSLFRLSIFVCGMNRRNVWVVKDILAGDSVKTKYGVMVLNQPILANRNSIKSLWMNALARVLVDGGANRWLEFIQKNDWEDLPLPDIITGDFDSITNETKEYFERKSVKFIETYDQDETDFTKSLRELNLLLSNRSIKIHHIVVFAANSGRLDQIMGNLETLHKGVKIVKDSGIILMSSNSLTWLLEGSKEHTIIVPQEYVTKRHSVGIIPLKGPTHATTLGLKWDLENTRLAFGELVSTSNTFTGKEVKIECDTDVIWTVEYAADDS